MTPHTQTEQIAHSICERFEIPTQPSPQPDLETQLKMRLIACDLRAIVRYELGMAKGLRRGSPCIAGLAAQSLTSLLLLAEGVR